MNDPLENVKIYELRKYVLFKPINYLIIIWRNNLVHLENFL